MADLAVSLNKIELMSGEAQQLIVEGKMKQLPGKMWEVTTMERGKKGVYTGVILEKSAKNPKELRLSGFNHPVLKHVYLRLPNMTNREMNLPVY